MASTRIKTRDASPILSSSQSITVLRLRLIVSVLDDFRSGILQVSEAPLEHVGRIRQIEAALIRRRRNAFEIEQGAV
jgi:hypothetical protein